MVRCERHRDALRRLSVAIAATAATAATCSSDIAFAIGTSYIASTTSAVGVDAIAACAITARAVPSAVCRANATAAVSADAITAACDSCWADEPAFQLLALVPQRLPRWQRRGAEYRVAGGHVGPG